MPTYMKGTRVLAKEKPGTVQYVRFGPPNFNMPEAYSVMLDDRRDKPGYAGTMYPASDVTMEEPCP